MRSASKLSATAGCLAAMAGTVGLLTWFVPAQDLRPAPLLEFDSTATRAALDDIATLRVGHYDWPQLGGSRFRNNAPHGEGIPEFFGASELRRDGTLRYSIPSAGLEWNPHAAGRRGQHPPGVHNIKWVAPLGSQTYSTPVVANGHVYVGTNNWAGYLDRLPNTIDVAVLLCLDEQTGDFVWQYSSDKLPGGLRHDWPETGLCSSPVVDGDRLWIVTNRCEVVCLDTEGFRDGENDGPTTNEPNANADEADVIWRFDMMGRLGVYPHNMTVCSALTADGLLFVLTSNGVNETHAQVPAPGAPSFVALDRDTADVVWTDNSPGGNILHGQWASPAYGVFDGQAQVLFPGGDGWLYSFDPRGDGQGHARLLWKFDTNRKDSKYVIGNSKRNRNPLAAAPCIDDGLVYVAGGDEPERGQGPGELWCIDPTRRGDISLELAVDKDGKPLAPRRLQCVDPAAGERAIPNPNSAVVWHFDVLDSNNDGQIQYEEQFYGSLSMPVVCDGVIYAPDFAGFVHCLDAKTGRAYWHFDSYSTFWASALVVDGKVYIGSEMGELLVFRHSSQPVAGDGQPLAVIDMGNSVFATPIVANNVLYVTRKNMLIAIARPGANDQTGQESP